MSEPTILTDTNLGGVLQGKKPALILFTNGSGLRSEFMAAYKKAAETEQQILFARLDPTANPQAAARFDIGDKPVLVGWYNGSEVLRRSRPWGSDVPLAVEMLQQAVKQSPRTELKEETPMTDNNKPAVTVADAPVHVTDATFETEVLNSELPVLVDFWAEWCGPCRMVAPTLEKLAKEYAGQVKITKVNVDENPGLSQAFQIMSIPTIMLIKQRTIVFSQPGALPESAFRDLIKQLIALQLPPQQEQANPAQ
jgi:thioredoxin 1